MWKFSNSNSSQTLWPPDAVQEHKPASFYPTFANNNNGGLSLNAGTSRPIFGVHGSSLHLNSAFTQQQPNQHAFNPATEPIQVGAMTSNGILGTGFTAHMKRFLIFDQSGDRTKLIFSSVRNPQQGVNPTLLTTQHNSANASEYHETDEHEEMHEDTDEIDALLYSDSESSNDIDEASTGHSPLGLEEEVCSPIPCKRRKLEHSELNTLLSDTASSAVVPNSHFTFNGDGEDAELSYASNGSKQEDAASCKIMHSKRERLQTTVNLLRRIIPGGKGKDTAAVLDDAIRYLKSLKLQAEALDCTWIK